MRTFQAENGNTLTALNDTQAEAMLNGGMVEITEEVPADLNKPDSGTAKKPRKSRK